MKYRGMDPTTLLITIESILPKLAIRLLPMMDDITSWFTVCIVMVYLDLGK